MLEAWELGLAGTGKGDPLVLYTEHGGNILSQMRQCKLSFWRFLL